MFVSSFLLNVVHLDYKPIIPIDEDVFKAYVRECQEYDPILSKEAGFEIMEFYKKIRKASLKEEYSNERVLVINPRWVQTMCVASKAAAALRWSDTVHPKDVELGIITSNFYLNNNFLQQPISGEKVGAILMS